MLDLIIKIKIHNRFFQIIFINYHKITKKKKNLKMLILNPIIGTEDITIFHFVN